MSELRHFLSEDDMFHLRSILRNLDDLRAFACDIAEVAGYGIAHDALKDNRDWLEHFITRIGKQT